MSRTRLLRRLERLTAQVEALESVIDTSGLEALSDEELDALWLELGGEPDPEPVYRVVTSRGVEEAVPEEFLPASPEPEEPEEPPEPAPVPLDSTEPQEEPPATAPDVLRSCDYVPRSPWAGPPVARGESEEITFREEPLERVYGVHPPRRRRRRSRRG